MSAVADNSTTARLGRSARVRVGALSAERVAVAALALLSLVLAVVTYNTWGDIWLDSGYDLVAGAKVSHASPLYLDYDYWYGPLGPLALGAVFEVFGISMGPAVGFGLVLAALAIASGYALARGFAGPVAALIAGALVAVPALSNSNVSFVQPHTMAAPLGMLCCLAALFGAWRYAARGGRRWVWLPAIGIAVGLAGTTRPESFGAAVLAIGGWLVVRFLRARDRRTFADMFIVGGSALVVVLVGYGAFFVAGEYHHGLTLDRLLHDDLFPRGLMRESVGVVYDDVAPRTLAGPAKLAAYAALYAGGLVALLACARLLAAGGRRRIVALGALAAATLGCAAVFAVNPDTLRYYFKFALLWVPAGAAIAAAVLTWRAVRRREAGWDAKAQLTLMVALMLVGFTYIAYAKYIPYPNPDFPQETAYAMPVLAAFLVWLHLAVLPEAGLAPAAATRTVGTWWLGLMAACFVALLVHDARQESFSVTGLDGTMKAKPADGVVYQQAVDLIQRETKRSEPILLAPQMTSLYFLTGRRDALRQLSLLPGALEDEAAQREAIRTLQAVGLKLAIVDRRPLTRYEHGVWGVGYDRLVGDWLRKNFTHTTTLRGPSVGGAEPRILDVWQRRTL